MAIKAAPASIRARIEADEDERLAPYASRSRLSRGRRYPDDEHDYRTAYQRDRDKIIYTPSFRRLEYKTQVFINYEGDHYRTRLTHTLEATQIARTIARALRLNEDLTEAITLAHDLGHPPFGHASEEALDELMRQPRAVELLAGTGDPGGFEHNIQSLRIVDRLESHHPGRPGLNLTWEVREGICKHRSMQPDPRFGDLCDTPQAGPEAQVANLADEIAYDCHDLDDSIRAELLTFQQLEDEPLWQEAVGQAKGSSRTVDETVLRYRAVKHLINLLVTDVIVATQVNIRRLRVQSPDDARVAAEPVVAFSSSIAPRAAALKAFMHEHVYYHFKVARMKAKARRVMADVFNLYLDDPTQLPTWVQARTRRARDPVPLPRAICDYVAGMTDRYAVDEFKRLFDLDVRSLP